ncbi:unnamed protein product [Thelazia callipaeda]|uniref:DUF4704 domain-containing protein n=1 Tax=Thelazia callipaeda TaxID=103827 RepID=A0A0N5CVE3_THECL|nr:unnamed protein product [Thelazia callipaeda]
MFFTGVNDILNQVVPAQIENAHLEIEARERLKGFFMSHKGHDNRYGFWNSLILRTQESLAAQGRLFMIIFGPVKTNSQNKVIDWELLANETIESHIMCEEVIGPLSFSLNSMISDVNLGNYAWSDHSIFNLLEEITTVPNSWTLDNFASLLILKPRLMYIALQFRITYNLVNEAADLFHTINSVLHHWGVFYIEAVASVILQIFRSLSSSQRRQFLSSYLMIEAQSLQEALTTNPFDRDCFYVEMAIRRAVSPFILLLATSI